MIDYFGSSGRQAATHHVLNLYISGDFRSNRMCFCLFLNCSLHDYGDFYGFAPLVEIKGGMLI
jgi:hypothetical protein